MQCFFITLTVHDSLRGLCKLEPATLYDLLLREAAGALNDLRATKLGGTPGFTTVQHTWGRQMQHHLHVHVVIPAVVLDANNRLIRFPAKRDFSSTASRSPAASATGLNLRSKQIIRSSIDYC